MGVRERVERAAGRWLRPWLSSDVRVRIVASLTHLHLHLSLEGLHLHVPAFTSLAMASSPAFLHTASVDRLILVLAPFRRRCLTLEVEGLHFVFCPRRAGDNYWKAKEEEREQQTRMKNLSDIDPQGAAKHAAALRLCEKRASGSLYLQFFTELALFLLRLELRKCSLQLVTISKQKMRHGCIIFLDKLIIAEGSDKGIIFSGGLLVALFIQIIGSFWKCFQFSAKNGLFLTKLCITEGLRLQLESKAASNEITLSNPAEFFSATSEVVSISGAANDHNLLGSAFAPFDGANQVLTIEVLQASFRFDQTNFQGLDLDIPNVLLGFNNRDLQILLVFITELQGSAIESMKCSLQKVQMQHFSTESQGLRSAKELWKLAVIKAIQLTPSHRLYQVLQTGLIRLRYASLYGAWLHDIGWVGKQKVGFFCFQAKKKQQLRHVKLAKDIADVEKQLPAEAVTLARALAFHRIAATINQEDASVSEMEAPSKATLNDHLHFYGRFVNGTLQVVWKRLMLLFKFCRNRSHDANLESGSAAASLNQNQGIDEQTMSAYSLQIFVCIGRGSLTVACTSEYEVLLKQSERIKCSNSQPAICLSMERFSLSYGTSSNAMYLRMISGQFTGCLVTVVPVVQIDNEIQEKDQLLRVPEVCVNLGRWTVKGNDSFEIFSTSYISENAHTVNKIEGLSLNSAIQSSEWILKGLKEKKWCGWATRNQAQRNDLSLDSPVDSKLEFVPAQNLALPFLVAEFQSPNTSILEQNIRTHATSCTIIMGELSCSVRPSLIKDVASIFGVFHNSCGPLTSVSRLDRPDDGKSSGNSNISVEVLWSWGEECLHMVEHFLSSLIPCFCMNFYAVLESPKLRIVLPETNLENYLQHDKPLSSEASTEINKAGMELVLLVGCEQLEVSMSPVDARANISCPQAVDELAKIQCQRASRRLCLRKPILDNQAKDAARSPYTDHEQIGNNLIFSITRCGVMLEINCAKLLPLLNPFDMLMEALMCRDHSYSLFNASYSLSADISCKFSAMTFHLYVDEVLSILQALSRYKSAIYDLYTISNVSRTETGTMKDRRENSPLQKERQSAMSGLNSSSTQERSPSYFSENSLYALVFSISCNRSHIIVGSSRIEQDEIVDSPSQSISEQSSSEFDVARTKKGHVKSGKPKYTMMPSAPSAEGHVYTTNVYLSCNLGESFFPKIYASLQRARLCILDPGRLACSKLKILSFQSHMHSGDWQGTLSLSEDLLKRGYDQEFLQCILSETCIEFLTATMLGLETLPSSDFSRENFTESISRDECREKSRAPDPINVGASYEEFISGLRTKNTSSFSTFCGNEKPVIAKQLLPGVNGVDATPKRTYRILDINIKLGKILLIESPSEKILSIISSRLPGVDSLSLHFCMDKELKDVALSTVGGILVLSTEALLAVVGFFGTYMQLLAKAVNFLSEPSNDKAVHVADELFPSYISTINLEPSISLPSTLLSNNVTGVRRLVSAPPTTQESVHTDKQFEGNPLLHGTVSLKTSDFHLTLVKASPYPKTPEGFLMQVSSAANLEFSHRIDRITIDFIQLGIISVQTNTSTDVDSEARYVNSVRIPQFGSMPFSSSVKNVADPTSESTLSMKEAGANVNNVLQVQDLINSVAGPSTESSPSSNLFVDHPNCILECLKLTSILERDSSDSLELKWSQTWKGSCLLEGMEVAITTSELQTLLAVMEPLAGYSTSEKPTLDQSNLLNKCKGFRAESHSVLPEIPDGAIVAVKDARERLYISVEETPSVKGHYHLVGVWHYSLAGEKALFKVKYQTNQKKDPVWFSLLSVHARNSDGKPFRLHFQSGSSLASISSISDNSWELWQSVPYRHTNDDLHGLDRTGIFNNLVNLINKKSKDSLAFNDGALMLLKHPGNPFKVKVIANCNRVNPMGALLHFEKESSSVLTCHAKQQEEVRKTIIPVINCKAKTIAFTILHSVGYGAHLLPLLRFSLKDGQAVIQLGEHKARIFSGCKVQLQHFEAQNSCWLPITNSICTDIGYRIKKSCVYDGCNKSPKLLICKLKKVDVAISELFLDTCLFFVGALKLAGPYMLKNSPILANQCQVKNRTGVDLVCNFEHEENKQAGKVLAGRTNIFLLRHALSRKDCIIQRTSSFVTLLLEKPGKGTSTSIRVPLAEPGVLAARTRLKPIQGVRLAPGPILVIDVSRQSQAGIFVSISPMIQIHNATGLRLELQCRRPDQVGEGAIVILDDGDKVDDSMAAFDALGMQGELRKALASLNLGNYLLSIRPASATCKESSPTSTTGYEWSNDVKGVKAVKASGLFDKLHHRLKRTSKNQDLDPSFETVFCCAKENTTMTENRLVGTPGKHFVIRTLRRKVPVTKRTVSMQQESRHSVVSWQEQQEILLLPTMRVQNFLSSAIELIMTPSCEGSNKTKNILKPSTQFKSDIVIESRGSKAYAYADITALFMVVKHVKLGLVSKPLSIGLGDGKSYESNGSAKELKLDVDFEDSKHFAKLKVSHADDGFLEVILYSKFQLENLSNLSLACCPPRKQSRWKSSQHVKGNEKLVWPSSEMVELLSPQSSVSWLDRSTSVLLKREEENAQSAYFDLESLSGSSEISLGVDTPDNVVDWIQLGVMLHLPLNNEENPTHIVQFAPRYIVVNNSADAVCVSQDGFLDSHAIKVLAPGEGTPLHAQALPGSSEGSSGAVAISGGTSDTRKIAAAGSLFSVRFCLNQKDLDWSGPVCAAAMGTFYLKMRSTNYKLHQDNSKGCYETSLTSIQGKQMLQFAVADVQEEASSLIMRFRLQGAEDMPYRIQNKLKSTSVLFHQKGLTESEVLESGETVAYVWDNTELSHRLVISVAGTRLCLDLNIDKIRPWKSFFAVRNKAFSLHFPFHEQFGSLGVQHNNIDDSSSSNSLQNIGYEVYADGPTRILRICESADCVQKNHWLSEFTLPRIRMEMKLPLLVISIVKNEKQKIDASETESLTDYRASYLPIVSVMITALSLEAVISPEHSLGQIKVQRLEIDVKWQGAPFASLLRIHGQDRFSQAQTVFEIACVMSNRTTNPLQMKYISLLLQAIDLNLDEETLMKLVPFYRRSLADPRIPSRQIYFERFEIHPIKIFASFLPGQLQTDYTSTQETLRALLHSVIKVPSIKGAQIQLNGVLLSNALLTFRQLAIKCAQHYSWYAMRAIYIVRGSKLLPPAFASLFDDSAASSLDVFFDPSNGSIDLQGLTLGMFNFLSRAIRNKDHGGTSRYLGDLESTVKKAGSNLVFAIVTEVSDNVLKGAETGGLDGMVIGFRRGILNVAMEPSVLRTAVVRGGSTRRIHLQRSVGINEGYIEGYLQATLDNLFRQEFLKVKVVDDQVILKNLPPNSMLLEEIMNTVNAFLIGEGLLVGESSVSASHSLRRLDGTKESRVGPAVIALCEQLFIIFAVRALRQQTRRLLRFKNEKSSMDQSEAASKKAKQTQTTDIHVSKQNLEKDQGTGEYKQGYKHVFGNFIISSLVAYIDGRLCRHIPNPIMRRIVSGFLLSFVE